MSSRSRYIDVLRVVAIVRVCVHHVFWAGWLTIVFPSMSIMFALGGCLTAASLERGGSLHTLTARIRRLLPPLWMLAAVAIPLMFLHGWSSNVELLYWVLPVANPPASDWGLPFALPLWYLRAYLWFVLLSPLLWWLFRRWPIPTLCAPMILAALFYSPWTQVPAGPVGDAMWTTAEFGTCWIIGYARHTRMLSGLSLRRCVAAGAGLAAAGAVWSVIRIADPADWISGDRLSAMLWGTGYALVLMRLNPSLAWLRKLPQLGRFVSAVNARAVSIYLWHMPALFAAGTLLTYTSTNSLPIAVGIAVLLLVGIIALVGWVEDVAARRQPVLNPAGGSGERLREPTEVRSAGHPQQCG